MKPRFAALLTAIPFAPKAASTQQIVDSLRAHGFVITSRSVQRDLRLLQSYLPLRVESQEKPFLWSWCSCPCGKTK